LFFFNENFERHGVSYLPYLIVIGAEQPARETGRKFKMIEDADGRGNGTE
jgi:hypothetical protein